ncbi:YicC/YloC family endoribonuclease [Mesoaciditoga lauensis]|uniref:YicC/YloC family endoribonuclease n=1 Tax=Mesoaciditoga lauensis TaxID=1495039 RepID=UPI001FE09700|nr:YicC/YloC family endoribonuclease [Mesoaciditoga lauensis]
MTGYSKTLQNANGIVYSLEIKGVNHKYLNVSFSLPSLFSSFEVKALPIIRDYVKRGSVFVKADIRGEFEADLVKPDIALAKAYYKAMNTVKNELGISYGEINVTDILSIRELFKMELDEEREQLIWNGFEKVLEAALHEYNSSREIEGEKLYEYLKGYIDEMENLVKSMKTHEEKNREKYEELIRERIDKFSNIELDRERLEQEIIMMIQRADIGEELSRLDAHILRARQLMESNEAVGSELDFVFQEIGREINTLSNKSKIREVLDLVVRGKTLVKKLREQVQNIE